MEWHDWRQTTWDNPLHHVEFHAWGADYPDPDNFMRVFILSQLSLWRNERYWELVEKARRITNHEDRMSLYHQADLILVDEAAIVPIMYGREDVLLKPWVRNSWAALLNNSWKDVVIEPH
jgi:oligopeptide transport system substrate-binding protein